MKHNFLNNAFTPAQARAIEKYVAEALAKLDWAVPVKLEQGAIAPKAVKAVKTRVIEEVITDAAEKGDE